jgi:hypothetical protein
MHHLNVPSELAGRIEVVFGTRGLEFLQRFPRLTTDLMDRWLSIALVLQKLSALA